ncbi:MAG: nitroreductase family protein [Planctomycetota bacterium]|jgi:nitroreductase|nr:nitroreductase family protein [Planctomycetota bacterium]
MRFLAAVFSAAFLSGYLVAGEASLPAPGKSGGKPVLDAIADRASAPGNAFPSGKISPEEISTILWAGSGLNRPDRWTIPFGMGVRPYVRIYLADENGVHLYKWDSHALDRITARDIRSAVNSQPFAKVAPCVLVFVSDRTSLRERGRMDEHWAKWTHAAAGAMTQQIYLAADSLGIGARYVEGMDVGLLRSALSIPDDEEPICIMPLGKR